MEFRDSVSLRRGMAETAEGAPRQFVVLIIPAPITGDLDHAAAARAMGQGILQTKTTLLRAHDGAGTRPLLERAGVFEISDSTEPLSSADLSSATARTLVRAGVPVRHDSRA